MVDLIVDKSNEIVNYNDALHKYWVKDTNQTCISVTTLIHKFTNFDEDFWSSYKAIEKILSEERFKELKPHLLDTKRFTSEDLNHIGLDRDLFVDTKTAILAEWADKRETSCIRGTNLHKEMELGHLGGKTKELQFLGLGGKFGCNVTNKIEPGQHVYPELLLSRISPDGKLRLAGQADLIIVDGLDVYVLDYKSSKTIDQKSYFNRKTKKSEMLKYPLNNIQDSNFWHYTLQLSTYAWMIQKLNPDFNIKKLVLLHYDHDGGNTNYECEYLKNDVERMLAFYKKQIEHGEFKESRVKMVF
jgi:hypothetical protein